jgi:hypothetical protein
MKSRRGRPVLEPDRRVAGREFPLVGEIAAVGEPGPAGDGVVPRVSGRGAGPGGVLLLGLGRRPQAEVGGERGRVVPADEITDDPPAAGGK